MISFVLSEAAGFRIDDIYLYTHKTWGEAQARTYINGLFECFEKIANLERQWRSIPAEFGVTGYYAQYEKHFIFWRTRPDGGISVLSILGQQMDIPMQLRQEVDQDASF